MVGAAAGGDGELVDGLLPGVGGGEFEGADHPVVVKAYQNGAVVGADKAADHAGTEKVGGQVQRVDVEVEERVAFGIGTGAVA